MSVIEDTEKKVNQMIEDRNKELGSLENSIAKDEVDAKSAREAMSAASDNGDLAKYQSAKGKLQNALDSKEMHTKRRDKLENDPLIDRAEYDQMIKALTDEMDKEVRDSIPKLAEATKNLEAIGEAVKKDADKTNDLLRKIQSQLYKNLDRHKRADGELIDSPRTYKGHFAVVEWSQEASHGRAYIDYKKEAKNERTE